jgi:hypothetical protein
MWARNNFGFALRPFSENFVPIILFGMTHTASAFRYHDQFFYVSNRMFFRLIELGLDVGQKVAGTDEGKAYVSGLRERSASFYPGYDLVVEREFQSREERKFWARVYFDLVYLIFRREIGQHDVTFWQHSTIGDAYLLARMITRSVQEEEVAWHPKTMAGIESEEFYSKGVDVKL